MPFSRRRTRRSSGLKHDVNVTPLIDVLLVLLVIFMVIAPVKSQGLPAEIPVPDLVKAPDTSDKNLVLSLDRNGLLRLNQDALDFTVLFPRLQEIFRTRSDRTIFIQADNEVIYNEVARIIDIAQGAGATRVGLMTSPIHTR